MTREGALRLNGRLLEALRRWADAHPTAAPVSVVDGFAITDGHCEWTVESDGIVPLM